MGSYSCREKLEELVQLLGRTLMVENTKKLGAQDTATLQLLEENIRNEFQDSDVKILVRNDELTICVDKEFLLPLMEQLKTHPDFLFRTLIDVTAIDYLGEEQRFQVIYNLLSMVHNQRVRVNVSLSEGDEIPSITDIYASSDWYEREVFDMYGIKFSGHIDLRRILTDYGFRGHPLRKDFPLTGYHEVRYDEVRKQVVYEPVSLQQEFRNLDFSSPWEGVDEYEPNVTNEKSEK